MLKNEEKKILTRNFILLTTPQQKFNQKTRLLNL